LDRDLLLFGTLLPVGPRQPKLVDQWFSLLITTAYACDPDQRDVGPPPAALLPWHWEIESLHCAIGAYHNDSLWNFAQFVVKPEDFESHAAVPVPANMDRLLERIEQEEYVLGTPPPGTAGAGQERADDDENVPHLKGSLQYLATIPGDLPWFANLRHYFRLGKLPGHEQACLEEFVAAASTAEHSLQLTVAPILGPREIDPDACRTGQQVLNGWRKASCFWPVPHPVARRRMKCYVRPLELIASRTDEGLQVARYLTDGPALTESLGPCLRDYWFRTRHAPPEGFRIEEDLHPAQVFSIVGRGMLFRHLPDYGDLSKAMKHAFDAPLRPHVDAVSPLLSPEEVIGLMYLRAGSMLSQWTLQEANPDQRLHALTVALRDAVKTLLALNDEINERLAVLEGALRLDPDTGHEYVYDQSLKRWLCVLNILSGTSEAEEEGPPASLPERIPLPLFGSGGAEWLVLATWAVTLPELKAKLKPMMESAENLTAPETAVVQAARALFAYSSKCYISKASEFIQPDDPAPEPDAAFHEYLYDKIAHDNLIPRFPARFDWDVLRDLHGKALQEVCVKEHLATLFSDRSNEPEAAPSGLRRLLAPYSEYTDSVPPAQGELPAREAWDYNIAGAGLLIRRRRRGEANYGKWALPNIANLHLTPKPKKEGKHEVSDNWPENLLLEELPWKEEKGFRCYLARFAPPPELSSVATTLKHEERKYFATVRAQTREDAYVNIAFSAAPVIDFSEATRQFQVAPYSQVDERRTVYLYLWSMKCLDLDTVRLFTCDDHREISFELLPASKHHVDACGRYFWQLRFLVKEFIGIHLPVHVRAQEESSPVLLSDRTVLVAKEYLLGDFSILPHTDVFDSAKTCHLIRAHERFGDVPEFSFSALYLKGLPVPIRIPYVSGVQRKEIAYNQSPLIAPNPLGRTHNTRISAANIGGPGALYEYRVERNVDAFKLPRLRFGDTYQYGCYVTDIAGGLPKALSGDLPWTFDPEFRNRDLDLDQGVMETYWRRVGVGEIRVMAPEGDGAVQALDIPPVPDNVHPLWSEIWPRIACERHPDTRDCDSNETGDERKPELSPPLIMLYHEPIQAARVLSDRHPERASETYVRKEFRFTVRPPGVDIDTYERWWTDEHKEALRTLRRAYQLAVDQEVKTDAIVLDDPAVTHLEVSVHKIDFDTLKDSEKVTDCLRVPLNRTKPVTEIGNESREIVLALGDDTAIKSENDGIHVQMVYADNSPSLYRLAITPCVSKKFVEGPGTEVEARFSASFFKDMSKDSDDGLLRLLPFELLVEVPSFAMPGEFDLHHWLRVGFKDFDTVTLRLADAGSSPKIRNISALEVLKQDWWWQGRPLPTMPHPEDDFWSVPRSSSLPELDTDPCILDWEIGAFAEVDDIADVTLRSMPLYWTQHVREEDEPAAFYVERPGSDLRARYTRYSICAVSRYRGIWHELGGTEHYRVQAKQQAPGTGDSFKGPGWRRCFLPNRMPPPVKPLLLAMLPLTAPWPDFKERAPQEGACCPVGILEPLCPTPPENRKVHSGYLVVVEGAAFDECGITETMECRVEVATVHMQDGTPHFGLYEMGPDPVLSTDRAPANRDILNAEGERSATPEPIKTALQGPFGYTFDMDARRAKFNASAWYLPPFESESDMWEMRPFVKVSLRRKRWAGDDADDDQDHLWTNGAWIQFNTGNNFGLDPEQWDTLWGEISCEDELNRIPSGAIVIRSRPIVDFMLHRNLEHRPFVYFLLVTGKVVDFRGVPSGEEQFLGFRRIWRNYVPDWENALVAEPAHSGEMADDMLARIVQVEMPLRDAKICDVDDTSISASSLLRQCFGGESPDPYKGEDATARIVHVSMPFPLRRMEAMKEQVQMHSH
jgi:hypothetical protein